MLTPASTIGSRNLVRNRLILAALLVVLVVCLEWWSDLDYSLGIFYIFAVVAVATVGNRWHVLLMSIGCAWIRSHFQPELSTIEYALRFAMATLAYAGVGLFVVEISYRRRALLAAYASLQLEQEVRAKLEGQLRALAESSPAGIVTLGGDGQVIAANRAAREMLGYSGDEPLIGIAVAEQLPFFSGALALSSSDHQIRTSASSWAKRKDGVSFPVMTWFSTYRGGGMNYLAGIVVDMSEDVRDRERESLRQIGDYNRLLAGAVSHEIRNLCSAIRVVTTNLGRRSELMGDVDFGALTTLVESLARIASFKLKSSAEHAAAWIELGAVLEQLRVVIEPDWSEVEGEIAWQVESNTPILVHADAHGLLQVLLNLTQNSLRAAQSREHPRLIIEVKRDFERVTLSIIDSGPGVADASILFQPFRPDADGTGLGLYISRTLVRSFDGEVTHIPTATGCRFDVTLLTSPEPR